MANFSASKTHRSGFASRVCQTCYDNNTADADLLNVHCRAPGQHHGRETLVTWSGNKRSLVSVRPLPNPPILHGKYVRCNGELCRGDHCTYAHSEEELLVWNNKLEERRQREPSFSMPPSRQANTRGPYPSRTHDGGRLINTQE